MAGNVTLLTGVRRLFYVVSPGESSFKDLENVPKYTDEAVPFFLLLMTLETLVSVIKGDKKVRWNDGITSMSAGVFSRVPKYLLRTVEIGVYIWIYENLRVAEFAWDSAWTWWLTFIGVDLGYYWFHRLAHEVNFMWAAHQVHHSSEDYNLTTATRQSILQRYTSWVFYLPMALCIPPSALLVHLQFNLLYQFWIHTQYVKSLGPLEYILNTPSHHRVHHGRNPYCIDKNYAGTLIIWDRIFGTFQAEGEAVAYGLVHPINTFHPINIQFCHLKYMWGRLREEKGVLNKLSVIFKGPGWMPGKPRLGDIEDIPKVKAPAECYDTTVPVWCSIYIALHFGIVVFINQGIARNDGLPPLMVLLAEAFVLLSLTSFGWLFDNSDSFPWLELFRCLLYLVVEVTRGMLGYSGLQKNWIVSKGILSCFILSVLIWVARFGRQPSSYKYNRVKKD